MQQGGQVGRGYNQAFAPQIQQLPAQTGDANYKSNTTKRYCNDNYCWSHGYDLSDWHHSVTCTKPSQGHVWTATRQNICGGCARAAHKVNWPTNANNTY